MLRDNVDLKSLDREEKNCGTCVRFQREDSSFVLDKKNSRISIKLNLSLTRSDSEI